MKDRQPDPDAGRTAALLVRVWIESDGVTPDRRLRGVLYALPDTSSEVRIWLSAAGIQPLIAGVQDWLTDFDRGQKRVTEQ